MALRWFLHRVIDRLVRRAAPRAAEPGAARRRGKREAEQLRDALGRRRVQRAETMGSLLKSITTIVIFAVFVIIALAELGFNVAPILASAGVLGVALGFGAQSLVKDFLSGVFMIFEDQYGVGDVVDLGEAIGTVEAVGLRVTRLRDVDGTVWYVRNGEILRVGNMSQNWARTVLDIPVALRPRTWRGCSEVLQDVAHGLWDDEDYKDVIIEEPEVWGVQDARPRRGRRPGDAQDRAAGAVGRGPRDARADQGALRPRGHRDRRSRSGRLAPRLPPGQPRPERGPDVGPVRSRVDVGPVRPARRRA